MRTTSAERVRVHRARRRRGKLRLTIDLHAGDLRQIALRGYEGAASSNWKAQAEAVTLFLTDTLVGALGVMPRHSAWLFSCPQSASHKGPIACSAVTVAGRATDVRGLLDARGPGRPSLTGHCGHG